jgi:hypothetical protein
MFFFYFCYLIRTLHATSRFIQDSRRNRQRYFRCFEMRRFHFSKEENSGCDEGNVFFNFIPARLSVLFKCVTKHFRLYRFLRKKNPILEFMAFRRCARNG